MNTRNFLFTLIVSSLCLAATNGAIAALESRTDWSSPESVTLPSAQGPIQAIVRHSSFIWRRTTDQNVEHHNIVAVVIPSTKSYWLGEDNDWQMHENKAVTRQFFFFANSIVGVSSNRGDTLKFYASSSQLPAGEASQELTTILNQKLTHFEMERFDPPVIAIGNVFGGFPFTSYPSAQGEPAPDITKIEVSSNIFTIDLAGGKNNVVTASITFDSAFKPLSASLNGKQVFPQ